MQADKAVFDTNIYLSAILSGKLPKIIQFAADCQILIYTCPELFDEIERNLKDDFFKSKINQPPAEIIDLIKDFTVEIEIVQRFDRSADMKDNFLFDLAYSAKSYYLITHERALQNMKHVGEIQIVSPHYFFRLFDKKW